MDDKEEGILLGELKQFKVGTLLRLDQIDLELRSLSSFKWKAMGVITAVVIVFEALVTYLRFR